MRGITVLSVVGVLTAWVLALLVGLWALPAHGGEDGDVDLVSLAIRQLQPTVSESRLAYLSSLVVSAGDTHEVDHMLLVAIIMRESSFRTGVEDGTVRGALGERGLMQSHGVALQFRPSDCSPWLEGARCQVETGTRYLAWVREHCGGSTWRWVAGYGMSRCPTEEAARRDPATRRARQYYEEIGGSRWE